MMREASDEPADIAILDKFTLGDLDADALARYRRRFQTNDPGSTLNDLEDLGFLFGIEAYRRDRHSGKEGLTVAGLLLFGKRNSIREWRSRHLIDYRFRNGEDPTQERWDDRVVWEEHLFGAFEAIYPKLVAGLPQPFKMNPDGTRALPPEREALQEALINLLVHADYNERAASLIKREPGGYYFRNPGASRVRILQPEYGDRSDPRNPTVLAAFRFIGLADEGGSGVPKIVRAWKQLKLATPQFDLGFEDYEFELQLSHAHMFGEDARRWLRDIGEEHAGEAEQVALVHAAQRGDIDNHGLCQLTGCHPADATKTLTGLRDRGQFEMDGERRTARYHLSEDARAAWLGTQAKAGGTIAQDPVPPFERTGTIAGESNSSIAQVTDNQTGDAGTIGAEPGGTIAAATGTIADVATHRAATKAVEERLRKVWPRLWDLSAGVRAEPRPPKEQSLSIVEELCRIAPLALMEVAELLGLRKDRTRVLVQELLAEGRIRYTLPDKPSSPKQRYVATQAQQMALYPLAP